jgi:acetyltransferase
VSQLMGDNPEIEELDINPFVVQEHGGVALDARIRIGITNYELRITKYE